MLFYSVGNSVLWLRTPDQQKCFNKGRRQVFMKKTTVWTLILLLPALATLAGLTALPAVCHAQEELSLVMSLDKEGVIQAGDSVTVTLIPSGGHPPYTYDYTMVIFEDAEPHSFWSGFMSDNSYTWTVGFGDSLRLIGRVRDGEKIVSCYIDMNIRGSKYNPVKITGTSLSPGNTANIGETITYSVQAEGGQPPYTYGYEVMLYREGSWTSEKSDGHSSSSFSYKVTAGTRGSFYATVEDAVGRKVKSEPLEFTILGDNSPRMVLNIDSYSLVKLGKDRYQAKLQVSVEGGVQPVKYVCWWYTFIGEEMTDVRMLIENTDGAFSFEGSFDLALAEVYAVDADGWGIDEYLEMYFNTADAESPVLSELINMDLLRDSMRDNLYNFDWIDLIAQLYGISEPDSSPGLDMIKPELIKHELINPGLVNPKLVNPGLVTPEATEKPVTTAPQIVKPDLLNPDLTKPQLPPQLPPNLPKR
jgi:hypothetical protein